ncbi:MAG: glycosyltransferase [Candidatus Bilamarchaeum sp.]
MRLLIATPFLENKGGLERVILKIAQNFNAKILSFSYNPDNTFEEFKSLEIEVAKPGLISKMPFGKRVTLAIEAGSYFYNLKVEKNEFDLINAHQTPSEWIRNKNSPVLWYCHSPNREAFDLYQWRMKKRNLFSKFVFWGSIKCFKHIEYQTVPKIEYIFTNSKNSQARVRQYLKRDSEILYPGVEIEKFRNRSSEQFFFYPSRIVPEKDIEFAINAFNQFSKKNPSWKLIIAGGISNRPEHLEYLKMLKSISGKNISIQTNISDAELIDLYSRCFCVLYTPVNEDFGLVPLESFASSKPCIARNEGGPKETIIDGVDGFLVDNIEQMVQKMQLLAQDPELCANMGKAGRKKVEREFTWKVFLDRFESRAKKMIELKSD